MDHSKQPTRRTKKILKHQPEFSRTCGFRGDFTESLNFHFTPSKVTIPNLDLKELMYLSTRFKWRSVLDYHRAGLLEIERGQLKWGESFQLLQSTTLAGGLLVSNNRGGAYGSQNRTSSFGANPAGRSEGVVFCKNYQRGICQQPRDHYGQFYGENRLLKHICANCWLNTKVQAAHPETSDDCPLKQQQ